MPANRKAWELSKRSEGVQVDSSSTTDSKAMVEYRQQIGKFDCVNSRSTIKED
jgi:hypothetical protein